MIRILSILFVLSAGFQSHAQSDNNPSIDQLLAISDQTTFPEFRSELQQYQDSLTNKYIIGDLTSFRRGRKRYEYISYGFGFSEYQCDFYLKTTEESSSYKSNNYRLKICFDDKDSTIVYTSLSRYNSFGRDFYELPIEINYDSTRLETYYALHDSLYGTDSGRNFNYPPFFSKKYYGPLCMNHGSDQHDEMLAAVENNQKEKLVKWIRSFNIVDKAFGAAGLYFLKKKGVELSQEEQLMLETTQKLRAHVQTDLGLRHLFLMLYDGRLDRRFESYVQD